MMANVHKTKKTYALITPEKICNIRNTSAPHMELINISRSFFSLFSICKRLNISGISRAVIIIDPLYKIKPKLISCLVLSISCS